MQALVAGSASIASADAQSEHPLYVLLSQMDGVSWTYTGVAGNSSGVYTDGTKFAFSRRERPHPVFGHDGVTIVAITNGVQYKDSTTAGGDAVFTFLQPVHTV